MSELVTNAVLHSSGDVRLHLDQCTGTQASSTNAATPTAVRITVFDHEPPRLGCAHDLIAVSHREAERRPAASQGEVHLDTLSEHGRGLLLVAAIADTWEVRPHGHGKRVTATISLRRSPPTRVQLDANDRQRAAERSYDINEAALIPVLLDPELAC